jgi:hypothetical protein
MNTAAVVVAPRQRRIAAAISHLDERPGDSHGPA